MTRLNSNPVAKGDNSGELALARLTLFDNAGTSSAGPNFRSHTDLLTRSQEWVKGLGRVEWSNSSSFNLDVVGRRAISERVDLTLTVTRPSERWWNRLASTRIAEEPLVSIQSRDVHLGGRLTVILHSGVSKLGVHRDRVLCADFYVMQDMGCLSSRAGPRAEAYARGAFLGYAIAINPDAVTQTEHAGLLGVIRKSSTNLQLSKAELKEAINVIQYGWAHYREVFPIFSSKFQSRIIAPDLSVMPDPSILIVEIIRENRLKARITLNLQDAVIELATLTESGKILARCRRTCEDIVSATAMLTGARHALEQIYGNHEDSSRR